MTSGILVRVAHIRQANLCTGGARTWFERHGLSWRDFINDGIPVESLEATGDPLAFRVTAEARGEHSNGIA